MSMPVDILDKRTVEIGFIGLGLMGETAYETFALRWLEPLALMIR
jgi:hypothetical protein